MSLKMYLELKTQISGVIVAQFRLTKKFSTDLKVNKLESPALQTTRFDDWFIDVIRVQRKKVAIATHAKSLLTFLLPYEQVGRAKSVPDCIAVSLKRFLNENDLDANVGKVDEIFLDPPVFCKTDNRKVLGHMNDFKRCIEVGIYHKGLKFDAIDWDDVMHSINNMPIGTQGYTFATDLAKELFSGSSIN